MTNDERKAWGAIDLALRQIEKATKEIERLRPNHPPSTGCYVRGCRSAQCTRAWRDYWRVRNKAKRIAETAS